MIFLIISFIAGVVTVLAPCILPLLPIIVGGSFTSNEISKKKSFIVILSLGVSVILFTFLLKVSTLFINVPEVFWKWISGGIVIVIGVITLFPKLWESNFIMQINIRSNALLGKGDMKQSIWGDVIVGAALGPVFSTCSPTYFVILATVLPVSLLLGSVYMLIYVFGLCLALFAVTFFSSKLMSKAGLLSDTHGYFKKSLGVLFIVVGLFIISGIDKKLQISILDKGYFDVTKIEQKLLEMNTQSKEKASTPLPLNIQNASTTEVQEQAGSLNENLETLIKKEMLPTVERNGVKPHVIDNSGFILAPEISTPDGFINTNGKPITISEFKGKKVVLVSFWTFSCINCKRTLPYLNDWYSKYKDQGLVIVSIHTPEFAFERVQKNVEDAVTTQSIKYPVVLDNDYSTWNSYGNQYWPRKYLVNKDGYIIYDHAGEGDYEETERQIKKALEELHSN